MQMPYVRLSDRAMEFAEACYHANLVQTFDWMGWAEGNAALVHEGKGLESAGLDCIVRLVTAHLRADRFVDGHILEVRESGLRDTFDSCGWNKKRTLLLAEVMSPNKPIGKEDVREQD